MTSGWLFNRRCSYHQWKAQRRLFFGSGVDSECSSPHVRLVRIDRNRYKYVRRKRDRKRTTKERECSLKSIFSRFRDFSGRWAVVKCTACLQETCSPLDGMANCWQKGEKKILNKHRVSPDHRALCGWQATFVARFCHCLDVVKNDKKERQNKKVISRCRILRQAVAQLRLARHERATPGKRQCRRTARLDSRRKFRGKRRLGYWFGKLRGLAETFRFVFFGTMFWTVWRFDFVRFCSTRCSRSFYIVKVSWNLVTRIV